MIAYIFVANLLAIANTQMYRHMYNKPLFNLSEVPQDIFMNPSAYSAGTVFAEPGEYKEEVTPKPEANKQKKFQPTWASLDTRTIPSWYDEAKFGIFVHWGVYSVPAYSSEWFWWHWKGDEKSDYDRYMKDNFPKDCSYQDMAPQLTGINFDADEWARIVKESGAKYFVFTSKHHEGFTHWPSEQSWNWNSVDIGPKRDVVGELRDAFKKTKVKFGLYFSLYEWFNPMYKKDKKNDFKTQEFVEKKIIPQLRDLVKRYKPWYIWSDGDWEATSTYWNSTNFLAWLYNESPVKDNVVVNDRWGKDANCRHGDTKNCKDRYSPGHKPPFKWENAMTIDSKSWGFRKEAKLEDYLSTNKLIETLAETVSCGGNLLMNVGPTSDGRILPIFQERLKQIGDWLKINGEAIYETKPWRTQKDPIGNKVWYTSKFNRVYAIMCRWPKRNVLFLREPIVSGVTKITLLGYSGGLKWAKMQKGYGVKIDLRNITLGDAPSVRALVFILENVK